MAIFNSYVSHYQRVNQSSGISYHPGGPWDLVPGGDVGLCRCPGSRDVAKHPGRSFDIINFTEIAWIFHNKVRYRDIHIYMYIYIHMYNTYIYILSEASESVLYVVTWHFAKAQAALVAAVKMTRICGIMPGASMGHDGTKWRRLSQPLSSIEMPLGWSENCGAPQFWWFIVYQCLSSRSPLKLAEVIYKYI